MISARVVAGMLSAFIGVCLLAAPARGRANDTLVIAQAWEPQSLNPLLHIDYNAYELDNLVYSMLLQQDAAGRLVPDLATSVPSLANGQISADGLRIVYHLRRNIRWQDGQPLTARDVAFTFHAIMNPKTAVPSRSGYEDIDRIETPDERTIVVRLKHRFASFLNFFFAPAQGYPVLPAHLLARYPSLDAVPFNSHPIGSGPYRVTAWHRGDRLELHANPRYFAGPPRIPHLIVRYVPNGATIVDELRTGEADVYFMADPSEAGFTQGNATLAMRSHPVAGIQDVVFNTATGTLRDARLRRALVASIDVPYITRIVGHGMFSASDAQRGEFYWAFAPSVPRLRYDPVNADRMLDGAGWRRGSDGVRIQNGRPLELVLVYRTGSPADGTIALLVQQELKARGIAVALKGYRIEQYVAPANLGGPLYGGTFQMAVVYGGFPDPDVSHSYSCAAVAPNGYNFSRYCNRDVDAALRSATSTYNMRARINAYTNVQRIIARDVPALVMWQVQEVDIVPARLRGFGPSIVSPFANAARWSLASR